MRGRFSTTILLALFFLGALPVTHADPTLQQRYLDVYVGIHDAEVLEKKGDLAGALKGFQAVYDGLLAIHNSDANWEQALLIARMNDCKAAIEKLQDEIAKASPAGPTATATPPAQSSPPPTDLAFKTSASPQTPKNIYPWKYSITTTMFYIGENSAGNAWHIKVISGSDSPTDRNGYATSIHASTFNPFYIALPFNDLTHPDKAKHYLPAGWARPNKDGKPISACKDRWVEIKAEDGSGHICYAQWEDVGPLRDDHAEYVFGSERPDTGNPAGLDVSPAVGQYLYMTTDSAKPFLTRWRFVDPQDVPPGAWLKYDEQAVIYTAMHQSKDSDGPPPSDAKK